MMGQRIMRCYIIEPEAELDVYQAYSDVTSHCIYLMTIRKQPISYIMIICKLTYTAAQRQNTAFAYFTSK